MSYDIGGHMTVDQNSSFFNGISPDLNLADLASPYAEILMAIFCDHMRGFFFYVYCTTTALYN